MSVVKEGVCCLDSASSLNRIWVFDMLFTIKSKNLDICHTPNTNPNPYARLYPVMRLCQRAAWRLRRH